MAVIDVDAVADIESDARSGKPNALYQLGLCYSTGQGVELDLVKAHKYFNLAAMKGVVEARLWRAELAQQMGANEIAEAQRLARLWLQETAHSSLSALSSRFSRGRWRPCCRAALAPRFDRHEPLRCRTATERKFA